MGQSKSVINVGLMGLGTVGSGVARALHLQGALIASRLGSSLRIKQVLVRDLSLPRNALPPDARLTSRAEELLADPDIAVIVEVMGGEHPALEYIQAAVRAGKHVVTANKEVLAKHGPELFSLAQEHGTSIRFEASVGGGIPIINPLLEHLLANVITGVTAIINGTTNYVLTSMAQKGSNFHVALHQAQELGYAEADPANDVDGLDAAYKLAVLSTLAFHAKIHAADVPFEGITRLAPADFRYAAELGFAIKLLAIGRRAGDTVQVRVHPALVPADHPLAGVSGVDNAVQLKGDLVGRIMFSGKGAGALPTTSAVIGDLLNVAKVISQGMHPGVPPALDAKVTIQPMGQLLSRYYIRLLALDKPGVMARITKELGDLAVSLASVIQKETIQPENLAEIVITTHEAHEKAVQQAVENLGRLPVVREVSSLIRVLDDRD